MPTNKKKKKLPSNPARGFATTSTISKAKPQNVEEENSNATQKASDCSIENSAVLVDTSINETQSDVNRPLHELNPEELEQQLEESTLQIFIESHGDKVKKSVSRQLSKLQTEHRLLRGQAMPLDTCHWLPEEIIQLITLQIDAQQSSNLLVDNRPNDRRNEEDSSGDDLLAKLWTLRQILPNLGFSLEGSVSALRHLIILNRRCGQKALLGAKDSCWGLDECLSWLAFTSKIEDLPSFEPQKAQKPSTRIHNARGPGYAGETGENISSKYPYPAVLAM